MIEDTKQREAEAFFFVQWHQPTEFVRWKIRFKSEVSDSSQYPRAAMLWIGEVEDATSIDDIFASAAPTGRPFLDFENLDFKTARGLRKSLTGLFKERVTTAEGEAQSEKRSFAGRLFAWIIYDFKIGGSNGAILALREKSKVDVKNDNVQAFDTKWDEISSGVTDRLTDSFLESPYNMQVEMSDELKYLL